MRYARPLVCSLTASWLAACSTGPGPDPSTVTDSAGIRVVMNRKPQWAPEASWTLSPEPIRQIGVASGSPEYELYDVRGAVLLSDGRIAVANSGTAQLRYYGADGTHQRDAGGEGDGPGEFRTMTWIGRLPDDSVAVYDQRQRRLGVFDPAGEHAQDVSLTPRDRLFFPVLLARQVNGTFAAHLNIRLPNDGLATGFARDSAALLRLGRDGGLLDTIGVFPNHVMDVQMRTVVENRRRLPFTLPFSPRTVTAAGADRLFVGHTAQPEYEVYDPAGTLTMIVRIPDARPPVPVTERDRAYIVDSLKERFGPSVRGPQGAEAAYLIRTTEESPLPEHFPAYDSLLADAGGNVWMRAYRRPGERRTAWDVFGPDGFWLGSVRGPDWFRATDIGDDYVLGIAVAPDGTARVQLYGLDKP